MLSKILPAPLLGAVTLLLHTINTFVWVIPILLMAIIKLILPIPFITRGCTYCLNVFASSWISVNTVIIKLTKTIHWDISIPENLSTQEWYLVIANHQSWVDIMALQQVFNGKIPFLKFFLKQQLFWVPVLGLAWWALDFPFMKRFTKSYLKKNPHMRGKDFETTKKACKKFKTLPISIMNFAEGTRVTHTKKEIQNSPYQHLLKPKAGGIGYVLTLMGNEINKVIDVTIEYPDNNLSNIGFWQFLSGNIKQIKVHAQLIEIPESVKGNYIEDANSRKNVQQWLNQLWASKDSKMTSNLLKKTN